ncbi:MAG: ion transporter [Microcoleaceae cyanobacterium]
MGLSNNPIQHQPHLTTWRQKLQRGLNQPVTDLMVGCLITISILLTFIELAFPVNTPKWLTLEIINLGISGIFAIELSLRWVAAPLSGRFWRNYALDWLAVLPLLQLFGFPAGLRFLRLTRVIRLFHLLLRYTNKIPQRVRRLTPEYLLILELLIVALIVGSIAVLGFERNQNPNLATFGEAFWFSIYSLFSGEPIPEPLRSLGGRMITVLLMLMHMTLFVVFTGTVSAFMVERLRKENALMELEQLTGHTIVCGWNRKAEIIVREYRAAGKTKQGPVVVIAFVDQEHTIIEPDLKPNVLFLKDDFTKVTVLEKAGIRRAETCIILSDKSHGRSEQDADARTILAALTAEKLNPNVYTCAELINREYSSHLALGKVNAYVVSQEHSAFLLAQVALNHGLMGVFTELLTYEGGNHFYRIPVKSDWIGKSFLELFLELKQTYNAILIAVDQGQGQFHVNPQEYTFNATDQLILIAQHNLQL